MYLYTYFISYFLISLIILFGRAKKKIFILVFLLQTVNIFFLKFEDIYDYQNYKIMFENPTISLDYGWRIISEIIGAVFNNYNIPIVLIILLNLILSSSIIFSINIDSLLQKSILIFLLIKWSMYEFITLRFGLASLLCLYNFIKNKPRFYNKYIVLLISCLLHYSVIIFSIKYFWKSKLKLFLIFTGVALLLPLLYTLDPRILHYLDADELDFNFSVFFTMLFFIILFSLAFYYEKNKKASHFSILLISFAIAIILFQRFDTFNRIFFGLFILSALNWSNLSESKISKNILTFCFLLFSQIVLLRYTFFASDVNKLIYK
jgi:hypothetical protein